MKPGESISTVFKETTTGVDVMSSPLHPHANQTQNLGLPTGSSAVNRNGQSTMSVARSSVAPAASLLREAPLARHNHHERGHAPPSTEGESGGVCGDAHICLGICNQCDTSDNSVQRCVCVIEDPPAKATSIFPQKRPRAGLQPSQNKQAVISIVVVVQIGRKLEAITI